MQLTEKELKIAKRKYKDQKIGCNIRVDRLGYPIEMRLTFEEWLDIWLQSGHWHERGCRKGQYCMTRKNDIGHYEIGNIEIKSGKENNIEKTNSAEWKEKQKSGAHRNMKNTEYISKRKTMFSLDTYRENHKLAIQKAHNKPISCDGIIYSSQKLAANQIAPSYIKDKETWLKRQMEKFPDRYISHKENCNNRNPIK